MREENTCCNCASPICKDEVSITKRLINRSTTEYYCATCLADAFGVTTEDIRQSITKSEITEYLEAAAETYEAENNVHIEVYISNDTVFAHLSTKYAPGDPYTISMVDAKDVYSVGAQYGSDLTGEDWVKDTDYAISVDGKVVGFPVCVEARGLLYNADAIESVTGESFDPTSIKTLDDLTAMCDKLVAGGMDTPHHHSEA